MTQSKGEYRVGLDFNPSGNPLVADIKRKAADLIDAIDAVPAVVARVGEAPLTVEENRQIMERQRLKAHAQTLVEDSCRTAVAAATKPLPEPQP